MLGATVRAVQENVQTVFTKRGRVSENKLKEVEEVKEDEKKWTGDKTERKGLTGSWGTKVKKQFERN